MTGPGGVEPVRVCTAHGTRVVIVSRRTMLSDSLERLLPTFDRPGSAPGATVLLLDLDEPDVRDLAELAQARCSIDAGHVRAVGFFDVFTPQHAHLAFELGVVRLLSLTAGQAEIEDAIFGTDPSTRVTSTRGVTDLQLARLATLTAREVEVLRLVASGLTTESMARELSLSVRTVSAHKRHALDKLEVPQVVQAVALAVAAGIVPPVPPTQR